MISNWGLLNYRSELVKEHEAEDSTASSDGWTIIYTDGSFRCGAAGLGVSFGPSHPRNVSERCWGEQSSEWAECLAILRAIESSYIDEKIIIKSDSKRAIHDIKICLFMAMFPPSSSYPVLRPALWMSYVANLIRSKPRGSVVIKWVKAHSGVSGNESADALARAGSILPAWSESAVFQGDQGSRRLPFAAREDQDMSSLIASKSLIVKSRHCDIYCASWCDNKHQASPGIGVFFNRNGRRNVSEVCPCDSPHEDGDPCADIMAVVRALENSKDEDYVCIHTTSEFAVSCIAGWCYDNTWSKSDTSLSPKWIGYLLTLFYMKPPGHVVFKVTGNSLKTPSHTAAVSLARTGCISGNRGRGPSADRLRSGSSSWGQDAPLGWGMAI